MIRNRKCFTFVSCASHKFRFYRLKRTKIRVILGDHDQTITVRICKINYIFHNVTDGKNPLTIIFTFTFYLFIFREIQWIQSDAEAKMRAVSAIIKHRNFDGNTYNHDIALLKLRKPVTFTKNIMPVCLPADESDPSGKTGIAVGWGRTSEGGALPGKKYHKILHRISNQ